MRAEALLDPPVAAAADDAVVQVRLGGVDGHDRDALQVELGAALAEELLEVHIADVARVVVSGDDDHPLARDLCEVISSELILRAQPIVRQVTGAPTTSGRGR